MSDKEYEKINEQNILESYDSDGNFDWDYYQYLCDIYSECVEK